VQSLPRALHYRVRQTDVIFSAASVLHRHTFF
jgi:hypothetical protein